MNSQDQLPVQDPCKKARKLMVGYSSGDSPGSDVPYLRLRGLWMREAGFVIGRTVKVEIREGRLMIETVD